MNGGRRALASALVAMLAVAVPAQGSIPVAVRLIVVSGDPHSQALNRAYAEYLAAGDNFLIAQPTGDAPVIYPDKLATCVSQADDVGACARAEVPVHETNKQYPPVALLATQVSASVYQWRCVGPADQDYWAERQTVTIDLSEAMFGTPAQRADWRTVAVNCIFAAGTESEGRIRLQRE